VHKTVLITGLVLSLSAATLAAIGEWAADGFGPSGADAAPPSSISSSAEHAENRLPAMPPAIASGIPATPAVYPSSAPGYTIRSTVPEVRLQFTVADERGRPVQNLSVDDVRIFDNQSPVDKVHDFARDEDLPLRLGIVLDASDSVKRVLPEEKAAAIKFLDQILRPQTDRAFVLAFGADVQVWQGSTSDRAALTDAVKRAHEPGWGTSLFDALYFACAGPQPRDEAGTVVHRAIVVLTDGEDTESRHDLHDVVAIAQRTETQIYTLTVHGRRPITYGDAVLQRLADETGGRFLIAPSAQNLEGAFTEIEQEMRSQYRISFPPQQPTPGFHSLEVQVRAPERLQIHARQGYYALPQ